MTPSFIQLDKISQFKFLNLAFFISIASAYYFPYFESVMMKLPRQSFVWGHHQNLWTQFIGNLNLRHFKMWEKFGRKSIRLTFINYKKNLQKLLQKKEDYKSSYYSLFKLYDNSIVLTTGIR